MISKKKTNQTGTENDNLKSNSPAIASNVDINTIKEQSKTSSDPAIAILKPTFREWCNRINPVSQFILMILGIFTLIAYISVSWDQSNKINENIILSDSARHQNREAIELAKQSGRSSDSINRKSILIADSSMKVSKKIAEMQEKFSKAELRAYLAIENFKLITFQSNKSITYEIYFTNTGKTPAYEITNTFGNKIGGTGIYDNEISNVERPIKENEIDMLGSGLNNKITIYHSDILSKTDSTLVHSEQKYFFIFGSIFYKDIFGDRHRTRFCRVYLASENIFYAYKHYNDAY